MIGDGKFLYTSQAFVGQGFNQLRCRVRPGVNVLGQPLQEASGSSIRSVTWAGSLARM